MLYFLPSTNLIGAGCLNELGGYLEEAGFKKAFVVTDKVLASNGVADKVFRVLEKSGISYELYDEVTANPTCAQVDKGYGLLQKCDADFIVSIGGGSPQDCASGISILAANGGKIIDYEGANVSKKRGMPVVAVNTTAGTSAELTNGYVITDEERKSKLVILDQNSLSYITVNDPELMLGLPAGLTAATGMDALTHAMEAVVTPNANIITNATALESIDMIFKYLPGAVEDGKNMEYREKMVYATFLAGMAFSNAGLGFVHAIAHQLGGMYNLPHGVCNAMLLPIVERENAKYAPEKFVLMAEKLGFTGSEQECIDYVIGRIEEMKERLHIPKTLKELGVENPDLEKLAQNSRKDAQAPNNPYMYEVEEVVEMLKKIV